MKRLSTLSTILLLAVGFVATTPVVYAKDAAPIKKSHLKKKAVPASKQEKPIDEDDQEPDVSASAIADYHCELNNNLTIYRNAEDDQHIALRWKKQLRRLQRVQTTTGANRFENKKNGWVWIDIPAKGMLLDAKKGQQLANECKHPEETKEKAPEATKG